MFREMVRVHRNAIIQSLVSVPIHWMTVETKLIKVTRSFDKKEKKWRIERELPARVDDSVWLSATEKSALKTVAGLGFSGILQDLSNKWKKFSAEEQHSRFDDFVRGVLELKGQVCNMHKSILSASGARKNLLKEVGLLQATKKKGVEYQKAGQLTSKALAALVQMVDDDADKKKLQDGYKSYLDFIPDSLVRSYAIEARENKTLQVWHNDCVVFLEQDHFTRGATAIKADVRMEKIIRDAQAANKQPANAGRPQPSPRPNTARKGQR
jgi:hypothetical protein